MQTDNMQKPLTTLGTAICLHFLITIFVLRLYYLSNDGSSNASGGYINKGGDENEKTQPLSHIPAALPYFI